MKRIIIERPPEENKAYLDDIAECTPVFAKKDNKLVGMVIRERDGWILRIGGNNGATGHWDTIKQCLKSLIKYDYEFFVEE